MCFSALSLNGWIRGLAVTAFSVCGLLSVFADEGSLLPEEGDTHAATSILSNAPKATLPILIYDPAVGAGAETALRQSYNHIRAEFLADLYTASKQRRLRQDQTKNAGFERFVLWFQ